MAHQFSVNQLFGLGESYAGSAALWVTGRWDAPGSGPSGTFLSDAL
jgi:hypothetical protein